MSEDKPKYDIYGKNVFEEFSKHFNKLINVKYPFWDLMFDPKLQRTYLQIACAGFTKEGIDVALEGDSLIVTAKNDFIDSEVHYSHKGISTKNFKIKYDMVPNCTVKGVALVDGILKIEFADKDEKGCVHIPIK